MGFPPSFSFGTQTTGHVGFNKIAQNRENFRWWVSNSWQTGCWSFSLMFSMHIHVWRVLMRTSSKRAARARWSMCDTISAVTIAPLGDKQESDRRKHCRLLTSSSRYTMANFRCELFFRYPYRGLVTTIAHFDSKMAFCPYKDADFRSCSSICHLIALEI